MKKMVRYISILVIILLSAIACSDDNAGGGVTDPFGGGNNGGNTGGGAVSFTIGTTQGQQGTIFTATPSVDVKITKVTVSLPAQGFTDELTGDGTTVFKANQTVEISEYVGVAAGQQWTFKFEGNLAGDNQAFDVTSNFTVQ